MKRSSVMTICTTLWLLFASPPPYPLAAPEFRGAPSTTRLDLADLIPLEAVLPGRLATLKQEIGNLADLTKIEERLAPIDTSLKTYTSQFERLRSTDNANYFRLAALKATLYHQREALTRISAALMEMLRQLEAWRTTWLDERQQWTTWQSSVQHDALLDDVEQTFTMAHHTINVALELILQQIKPLLAVQQHARDLQVRLDILSVNIEGAIAAMSDGTLYRHTPPMLSARYRAQFGVRLWYEARNGLAQVTWPDRPFMARQGWVMLLQGVLSLVLMLVIVQHRRQLELLEDWRFVARRPVATGCFVGGMTAAVFYEWSFITVAVAFTTLVGIAFIRLLGGLLEAPWKKRLVAVSITLLIATRLFEAVSLPPPLFRLFVFLVALLVMIGCLRWAAQSARSDDRWPYPWTLRLIACLFGVILLAELSGQAKLAEYLLLSSIRSLLIVLAFGLFRYLVHKGLAAGMQRAPSRGLALLRSDTQTVVRRLALLADILIGVVVAAVLLTSWGLYDNPTAALSGLLDVGVNLGGKRFTVGHVMAAIAVLFGAFLASGLIQRLIVPSVFANRQMETGVQLAIARLLHYALVFAGFVLALTTLGFDLTHLTILLSAMGVGIGFGLQAIVNNFLCGLILLFERPIRVGDTIELGDQLARIQKIGLRATTVQTLDQADVILPNSDLINQHVTNWTLSNRHIRLAIRVGVAYGSDVPLVMQTLAACGAENSLVMDTPKPLVLFRQFGDSSLDFELRVWIWNVDDRLRAISELHQEIDRRFRAAGIEIAFPQRDLHLRSVDAPATARLPYPLEPDA